MQAAQEKLGKTCLGSVLAVIFLLHSYLAGCQIHQPWSTKQAAYFIGQTYVSISAISMRAAWRLGHKSNVFGSDMKWNESSIVLESYFALLQICQLPG